MIKKELFLSVLLFCSFLWGMKYFASYRLPYWGAVGLYLLIYWMIAKVFGQNEGKEEKEWPTSGPIGKYGQKGLLLVFTFTGLLSFLNPYLLRQIILQGVGNLLLKLRMKTDYLETDRSLAYQLPFKGRWLVYNGGISPVDSHSWGVITQRYAYDFVIADEQMRRHIGNGTQLEDYYCYRTEILAAADGRVVKVVDNIRDAPFVGYGIADFLTRNFIGNHVIIKHATNEFGVYAHLKRESIVLAVGDQVRLGDIIGQCGHSGFSSEPHLHFHLQSSPNFYFSFGIPIRFSSISNNEQSFDSCQIKVGDQVYNQG